MNKKLFFLGLIIAFPLFSQNLLAQSGSGAGFGLGVWVIILFSLIGVILLVADNLLGAHASMYDVKMDKVDKGLFPSLNIFGNKLPSYVSGEKVLQLKKGHDIDLNGVAEGRIKDIQVSTFAIQPKNFRGIAPIPKILVEIGDEVKAGDALFFDKTKPEVNYVAPVSGEVIGIIRGAKRAITEVVILADKEIAYKSLGSLDLNNTNRVELVDFLKKNGFLPHINQRPYDIVPTGEQAPRDIYISTFDTAPLAPNLNIVVEGKSQVFQAGLDALKLLTDGKVHLGLSANDENAPNRAFTDAKGVEKHWFSGPHPAGNVGIQLSHVAPINAGEMVWTLNVQDVILLGEMVKNGKYDASRVIALTGESLSAPSYIRTKIGAKISDVLQGQNLPQSCRVISGDVLSGEQKILENFVNIQDDQITVIPEGDYAELFGWLAPSKVRPSVSKTFLSGLFKGNKYDIDTNTHGEKRAFVITGQYEQLLPMDTFPQHLMKAIMVKDLEKMEGLGIYELSEEDLALCEFACTSKMPLQKILRDGLDLMQEQE